MAKTTPDNFTQIMSDIEWQQWIINPLSIDESMFERPDNLEQRLKTEACFSSLHEYPDFNVLIQILGQYVQRCVPAYRRAESKRWIVSCLPSSTPHRLSAISINWMETFVIFYDSESKRINKAFIIVSEDAFRTGYMADEDFYDAYQNTHIGQSEYRAAGPDQIRIEMNDLYAIISVLQNEIVLKAARELNLRLMNRGKTPYSNFHSYQLADLIIE